MKQLQKILLALFVWGVAAIGNSFAQSSADTTDTIVTFRFLPGKDILILRDNEAELARLYALVDEHRTQITAGEMPVYVDGYCSSLPATKENLMMAFVRTNRVKSELITNKGLKESDFITANYARAYHTNKDMVVVTLHIPVATTRRSETEIPAVGYVPDRVEPASPAVNEPEQVTERESETEQVRERKPEAKQATRRTAEPETLVTAKTFLTKSCGFALRTNLLYDAFLLPTLGVEWRVNRDWGIKLDGSLSWWGSSSDNVQKVWLLNPEVRWYLLRNKRLYVGASGSYGEYNIYRYPLGRLFSKDTGYQGTLWSAGVTVGYQLCLSRKFSVDFNLGMGYTRSKYDSFGMTDGVRVSKERDKTKSFFGPTQAGISLIWTLGNSK